METLSEEEETLAAIHTHDYNILGHNPCGGIYVLIGQFAGHLKVDWCALGVGIGAGSRGVADGSDHGDCGALCCHGSRHGGGGSFQHERQSLCSYDRRHGESLLVEEEGQVLIEGSNE